MPVKQKVVDRLFEIARITGAANKTNGSIVAHDISQDDIQWERNWPALRRWRLAIPAAINEVRPA